MMKQASTIMILWTAQIVLLELDESGKTVCQAFSGKA
jgi:hypothetical protein